MLFRLKQVYQPSDVQMCTKKPVQVSPDFKPNADVGGSQCSNVLNSWRTSAQLEPERHVVSSLSMWLNFTHQNQGDLLTVVTFVDVFLISFIATTYINNMKEPEKTQNTTV